MSFSISLSLFYITSFVLMTDSVFSSEKPHYMSTVAHSAMITCIFDWLENNDTLETEQPGAPTAAAQQL